MSNIFIDLKTITKSHTPHANAPIQFDFLIKQFINQINDFMIHQKCDRHIDSKDKNSHKKFSKYA